MALPPVPLQSDLIQRISEKVLLPRMTEMWLTWFRALVLAVDAASKAIGSVVTTLNSAAVGTTSIQLPTLNTGLYRVTWYLRIARAAGTSSSAQLTLSWTDGGIAQSQAQAAVIGNTTTSLQTGTVTIHLDSGTTLDYAVAYASVGVPSMLYDLSIVVESLP